MQTFTLGLTGVTAVNITGVPSNTGYWAMDNVVVSVPEPETYAMLLVGLGLLGFMTRNKNSKISAS
jgi:hypothetical protein